MFRSNGWQHIGGRPWWRGNSTAVVRLAGRSLAAGLGRVCSRIICYHVQETSSRPQNIGYPFQIVLWPRKLTHDSHVAPLRSSDRKKLRQRVLQSYPSLPPEDGDSLVPDGLQSQKFSTHLEEPGVRFCVMLC